MSSNWHPARVVRRLSAESWGIGPIPYKETAVMPYVPWGYKRLADR